MEAIEEKMLSQIKNKPMTLEHKLRKLDDLFGSYKAEWLNERIFRFFAEPSYFNALKSYRPCVLIGGRGTG